MIVPFIIFHLLGVLCQNENLVLRNLGEKEYMLIQAKSSSHHGECWHNALRTIKTNCENLNDEEHIVLALALANCFLADSGHKTYDCHMKQSENERRECISDMSDRAFAVYNKFYVHATHICFFLNYEAWQSETISTVKLLYQVSSKMKDQLIEASEMQGAMLDSQKEGLKLQNELLDHGKVLGTMLKSSSETVNNMVSDFKESAKDQKELLYEIFSYIRTFQTWIIGEVSWFQSIIYYTVSCILCALFSSSRRTMDARLTLFTILSLNIIAERMLVQYYDNSYHTPEEKVQLVTTTWFYRKIALLLCAVTLFCTYYYYKDEHVENYKALQRIEHQLHIIQKINFAQDTDKPIRYSKRLAVKRMQAVSNKTEATDDPLYHVK